MKLKAPFPYFGGKSKIAKLVWDRLGAPTQYIEPFAGSAAMLLACPSPAKLEVIGDANGFVANFWRAVSAQPDEVSRWADYPVVHVDLSARHRWLMDQRDRLAAELVDAEWPGDAKVAGWWLWGQCAWIGSGWCDWFKKYRAMDQIPHVGNAGRGIQSLGKIPFVSHSGRGVQAIGATQGWIAAMSSRLKRTRVIHGDWQKCMNHHYGSSTNKYRGGAEGTVVFLDPPYTGFTSLYGKIEFSISDLIVWCRENQDLRIALCGHTDDYDLPGWTSEPWRRGRLTYGSDKTTDAECVWFSPGCSTSRSVEIGGLL